MISPFNRKHNKSTSLPIPRQYKRKRIFTHQKCHRPDKYCAGYFFYEYDCKHQLHNPLINLNCIHNLHRWYKLLKVRQISKESWSVGLKIGKIKSKNVQKHVFFVFLDTLLLRRCEKKCVVKWVMVDSVEIARKNTWKLRFIEEVMINSWNILNESKYSREPQKRKKFLWINFIIYAVHESYAQLSSMRWRRDSLWMLDYSFNYYRTILLN